ncbi:hypothetical protein GCM10020358_59030 [Amorphoplanes nipponensis]|uniref:Uncharacterized protein n=1 Tax=Actinoplanes nipponensis TaxID=135950 RepID=A0A919JBP5_9ACTN|nr:hypothetical protein [Actinoplanes nipponensis]GIE46883.1 hypothetical protein Ani05nite_04170 [Actinoplanes nipponensis]
MYYVDPRITVTSWYVETPDGRYTMADLSDVVRLIGARHDPQWRELRALHHGEEVLLFGSRNPVEFERVRRALIRAVEVNRDALP